MNPAILQAIESGNWAITPEALNAIIKISQRAVTAEDYKVFHQASQARKDAIVADLGEPLAGTRYSYVKDQVGVMYIDGPIIPRADLFSDVSGIASVESLNKDLQTLTADEEVKEILLVMDTPGGNVTGISEFAQTIKSNSKPVDAFVYGMAASAGYWIASAARKIYMVDTGEVGSIGVVTTYRDRSKQDEAKGIKNIEIVSSQSPYKRPDLATDEGKGQIQKVVDDLAEVFISTVATNRGVTTETVKETFGKGSLLVGQVAVGAGMADGITTLQKLLNEKNGSTGSTTGETKTILTDETHNENQAKAEDKMGKENETELSVAEITAKYPSAVAEIQKTAVEKEQKRIQAVEALAGSVSKMGPSAVATANKTIQDNKYDTDKTASDVSGLILSAVNDAQGNINKHTADDARGAGFSAEDIPGADDDDNGNDDDNTQADEQATAEDIASEL